MAGLFVNIMDSFFFISLGITFVLIFLIVFHFKQRINFLEKKCESLTDMCNSIIKELGVVKNICISNMSSNIVSGKTTMPTYSFAPPVPNVRTVFSGIVGGNNTPFNKIKVEDIEEEDEEEDDDDNDDNDEDQEEGDGEDQDEGNNEDEEDEEEDEENIEYTIIDNNNDDSVVEEQQVDELPIDELQVDDLQVDELQVDELQDDELQVNDLQVDELPIDELQDHNKQVSDENLQVDELNIDVLPSSTDTKVINIDFSENLASEVETPVTTTKVDNEKAYAKMKVESLRSLVLARGLSEDPSKIKRAELIKLLLQ